MDGTHGLIEAIQTLNAPDAFRPRLQPQAWQQFLSYLTPQPIRPGQWLMRQGERERAMHLLERGSLRVCAGAGHRMAILRPGAIVGEAGLLSDGPRMATVEVLTAGTVWVLSGARLEELASRLPAVACEVVRAAAAVLAVRLRMDLERPLPVC